MPNNSDDAFIQSVVGDGDDAFFNAVLTPTRAPSPSLTYSGFGQAESAAQKGALTEAQLFDNTRNELHRIYGPENVRPVVGKGNRIVDFEVRDKGARDWRSSGARAFYNQIMQQRQERILADTETEQGLPWAARAEANLKPTPEGMRQNLAARYGAENVWQMREKDGAPSRQFIVRETPTSKPRIFDSEKFSWSELAKDVTADVLGDVIESVPGAVGGAIGARLAGAAGAQTGQVAGDVAGSFLRQAVAGAFPGRDEMTPSERLAAAGQNVMFGAAGEGVGRAGSAAWDALNPRQWALRHQQRAIKGEFFPETTEQATALAKQNLLTRGKQALHLEKAPEILQTVPTGAAKIQKNAPLFRGTGIEPTPGQLTGSQDQIAFESALRQIVGSRDLWTQADLGRELGLARLVDKTFKAMGTDVGAEEAGTRFAAAGDAYVESIAKKRTDIAGKLFKEVDAESGNQRIVPLRNTMASFDRLIADNQRLIGLEDRTKVVQRLTEAKEKIIKAVGDDPDLEPGDIRATMTELQKDLEDFGRAARGKESFIKEIDRAADKRTAREIFNALNKDLREAADRVQGYAQGPVPLRERGDLPAKLVQARDAWAAWSDAVDSARTGLLDKAADFQVAGKAHQIAPYLLGKDITDDQLRASVKRLARMPDGQEALGNMRVAVMEKIIDDAAPAPGSALFNDINRKIAEGQEPGLVVSSAKIARGIAKNRNRLAALLADDPKAIAELNQIAAIAGIIGDRAGMQGSQTTPLKFIIDSFGEFSKGRLREGTQKFSTGINAKRLSIIFNDPVQRSIFLGLAKAKPNLMPKNAARMAAKMWALNEDALQRYEDEGEPQEPSALERSTLAARTEGNQP